MPRLPTVLFLLSLLTWTATAGALTLTDEERSWLAAHPDLRLGVDASWPPFEFRDDQGRYQGLAADYIDRIRQRLAIKLTPIEPVSWTVVLEQAKQAKLDLLPGIMSTPERQTYLSFTRPYPGLSDCHPCPCRRPPATQTRRLVRPENRRGGKLRPP